MRTDPVASDLSYLVLQKRRERGELSLAGSDCTNQKLYPVPSFIVHRRRFVADVEPGTDAANSKGRPEPSPIDLDLGKR